MNRPVTLVETLEGRTLLSGVLPGTEFFVSPVASVFPRHYGRQVGSDAAGNVVAIWPGDGANQEIFARRFSPAGVQLGDTMVLTTGGATKWEPTLAVAGNGNFVVTWWTGQSNIGFAAFNPAGVPLTPQTAVTTSKVGGNREAAAAMDDNGNFVIAWEGEQGRGDDEIKVQRYSASGQKVGKTVIANSFSPGIQQDPSVDMDADGDFVVTWSSPQDGSGHGIYGQRFLRDGSKQGGEFRANTTTVGDQLRPEVAMDAVGDAVVVWHGPDAAGAMGDWGRRYTAAGAPAGGEFRIDDPADGGAAFPSVDMARDGSFVVGWSRFVKAYSNSGVAITGSVPIVTAASVEVPQVVVQPGGAFVAVWTRTETNELFGETFILA